MTERGIQYRIGADSAAETLVAFPGGSVLVGEGHLVVQLERKFRQVAFFLRVPLADLALIYPEAGEAASLEAFLEPHLETLRALVVLGVEYAPVEVSRLVQEFPEVGRLLARRG